MKDRPDILKSHPQMTAMIKRRYSEIVDYPPFDIMSQSCWRADIIGSIRQHRGYLYTELRKGHLDGWKAQEKATYRQRKFSLGLKRQRAFYTMRIYPKVLSKTHF